MADPKPILSRLRAILDALIPQSAPSLAENPPPAPSLPEKLPAQEPQQFSRALGAPSPAEISAPPEDASAQELSPVDFSDAENPLERSAPEIVEVGPANAQDRDRAADSAGLTLSGRFDGLLPLLSPAAPAEGVLSEPGPASSAFAPLIAPDSAGAAQPDLPASLSPADDFLRSSGSAFLPPEDARGNAGAPPLPPGDGAFGETITRVEDHSRNIYYNGAGPAPAERGIALEDHSSNFYFGQADDLARLTSPGNTPARHRLALEP